jgi:hypothetical protein
MRRYTVIVVIVALLTVQSKARARNCYSPVTAWTGSYTLTGNRSGQDCTGSNLSYTTSHRGQAPPKMTTAQVSCYKVVWQGSDAAASGNVNDVSRDPCSPDAETDFQGSGKAAGNLTLPQLSLDASSQAYQFSDAFRVSGTLNGIDCSGDGFGPYPDSFLVWPFSADGNCLQPPTYPSIPLPAQVGILQQNNVPFSDGALEGIPTSWNLSFTLTPTVNTDNPCKQNGGSSIGCQNQSLGEDLPVVGTGFNLHYESERASGAGGNSIVTADAAGIGGWTLSVHHTYDPGTNTLFLGDGEQRSGSKLGNPVSFNGDILITSEGGN